MIGALENASLLDGLAARAVGASADPGRQRRRLYLRARIRITFVAPGFHRRPGTRPSIFGDL